MQFVERTVCMGVPGQLVLRGIAAIASRIDAPEWLQVAMIPILVQSAVRLPSERLPTSTIAFICQTYSLHTYGLLRV